MQCIREEVHEEEACDREGRMGTLGLLPFSNIVK
jgi:hypothetical protein